MKKVVLFLMVLIVVSCNPQKRMERRCSKCPTKIETITKDSVVEVVRDTMFILPADTSTVYALIKCDSMNEAYIKQIKVLSTQGVKTVVSFVHDTLRITTSIDTNKIMLAVKDKYKLQTETKTITVEKVVKRVPFWYWLLYVCSCLLAIIVTYFACRFLRNFAKFFN